MKKLILLILILFYSQSSSANERFIPLELFTGGEVRNDTEIKFTKADLVFGEKKTKKITGPENWKNPNTQEVIKVYKRTRKDQTELKTQLFTITNNGQCIGRVWDSRRGGSVIKNGCKFPLGFWKEKETRTFAGSSNGKPRKIELTILKLGKKPNSEITFNWKLFDLNSGELMDDNDYTFSPAKAMTKLNDKKL
tara:strand:+ start:695 stop:1276 length:582 start_codon:yes stop_codon:yes gene_type:complete